MEDSKARFSTAYTPPVYKAYRTFELARFSYSATEQSLISAEMERAWDYLEALLPASD